MTTQETQLQDIGRQLHSKMPKSSRNPVKVIDARAMELASRDAELRAALFRLVDVTPACRSMDDLARHLRAYLDEVGERPPPIAAAMKMSGSAAGRQALGRAASVGVKHMGQRFIIGETAKDARKVLRGLWDSGAAASVDLLGEATVTREEADRYAQRCHQALDELAEVTKDWPEQPHLERDSMGEVSRMNLSVKVSALTPLMRPEAPTVGRVDAADRMRPLLRRARDLGAHLHIDMESVDSLETTMELIFELLSEEEFKDGPSSGMVLQAYLRESPRQLDQLLEWAESCGRTTPLSIRLVKGAYWDHEVVEARSNGWSPPVFEVKAESDRNFEELTTRLLDARPLVRVAIASHNLRSVAHAIAHNRATGGEDTDLEIQILRGLGDELQAAVSANKLRVRAYCPVGDLVAGMAYLVRRLLENTSNDSFLGEQQRGTPIEELLAAP